MLAFGRFPAYCCFWQGQRRPAGSATVLPRRFPGAAPMKLRLTAAAVAALSLPEGKDELFAWDTTSTGFAYRLRRSHDGKRILRSWAVQYRHGGRSTRITLGDD